ncbi:MAG: 2-phospho-L-lactate guanylyltransferase [Steroidobacteraceae bacterium]
MSVSLFDDFKGRRHVGCCALIAIKERPRCKSRLGEQLDAPGRIALARGMLAHVLAAARAAHSVRQVIVISPERDTVPAEVPVLADTGEGLNAALTQAHRTLLDLGCREFLVLPADLPQVTTAEIELLVHAGRRAGFAIAPDAADSGTNGLCIVSGRPLRFRFGPDSKRLHIEEAESAALGIRVVRSPGLAFDVDGLDDLLRLRRLQWSA